MDARCHITKSSIKYALQTTEHFRFIESIRRYRSETYNAKKTTRLRKAEQAMENFGQKCNS
jgi:hypothetical protein